MTNKAFYQAAADEVASGHVDDALWIKVCAENPGAEPKVQQAKYVALRAREMAGKSVWSQAKARTSYIAIYWILYLIVLFTIAGLVAKALDLHLQFSSPGSPLPAVVFLLIAIVGIVARLIVGRRFGKSPNGAKGRPRIN